VLHSYSAGYLDAVEAVTEAQRAARPVRGTQQFAEKYRHFAIKETPWFHRDWYTAYDDNARTVLTRKHFDDLYVRLIKSLLSVIPPSASCH
jgi:hypothetical protein